MVIKINENRSVGMRGGGGEVTNGRKEGSLTEGL